MSVEEDVGRLDVAMDMALGMDEVERRRSPSSQSRSEARGIGWSSPRGPVAMRSLRLPPARYCMTTNGKPELADIDDLDEWGWLSGTSDRISRPKRSRNSWSSARIIAHGKLEHDVGFEVAIEGTIDMPHASLADPPRIL